MWERTWPPSDIGNDRVGTSAKRRWCTCDAFFAFPMHPECACPMLGIFRGQGVLGSGGGVQTVCTAAARCWSGRERYQVVITLLFHFIRKKHENIIEKVPLVGRRATHLMPYGWYILERGRMRQRNKENRKYIARWSPRYLAGRRGGVQAGEAARGVQVN